MSRIWLVVDKDGAEKIFNVKPFRGNTQKDRDHVCGTYVGEDYKKWYPKHVGVMKIQVMPIIKDIQ